MEGPPRSTIRHRVNNPDSTLGCSYCKQDTRENIHQYWDCSLHTPKKPAGLEIADPNIIRPNTAGLGRATWTKRGHALT